MAVQRSTHPSADTLKAFGLGKLDDNSSGLVMDHLDRCQECRQKVAALSGDDFLHRLRQAHSRSSTPAPAKSLAEVVPTEKVSTSRTLIPNLPPQLADNPHYEILRELGQGGMGVVYLAHNKLMDRLEVLKVVNKALLDHPGAVERFLREIRAAAKLSHANVVAAYHALQVGELLAFAMEYVEGQDLASLVKSQGPLPIAHACFYAQQAALGLHHAYEKQMVHRDIKPQNLILAREGKKHVVKVLDFGLAKVLREKTDDTGLTGEGKMLGTPDYIAPEQTLDAAKADIRADIYSLGCTLYFLLSGSPPFRANSLGAILLAHQMQEAKPLNLVRPEVPEELAAVVRKMMAKSPAQRYQTPREVVQALAPFIKPGAPRSSPELSVGPVEPKPAGKKAASGDRPAAPPKPPDVEESPSNASMPSAESRRSERFSEVTIGSQIGQSIPNVASRKRKTVRKSQPAAALAAARRKWLIGSGIGVGVILALLGLWAAGVFKVKTKEGTLELKNVPADAEVTVDGEKVHVTWGDGGKTAQIHVVSGRHKIAATKDGIQVIGEEVEIRDGERRVLTATLRNDNPIRQAGNVPEDDKWIQEVAGLSAEAQVQAVADKLKERNPGFDGALKPTIRNGSVTEFEFVTDHVTDISPVRALTGLQRLQCSASHQRRSPFADLSPLKGMQLTSLNCEGTRVSDLSPLQGMPLTFLWCGITAVSDLSPLKDMKLTSLNCGETRVSDLSPLKGMPLRLLGCQGTRVSDLSPLKDMPLKTLWCDRTRVSDLSPLMGMPLKEVHCDFRPERDAEILRSIKTLAKINDKPAAQFWKEVGEPKRVTIAPSPGNPPIAADGFVPLFNGKDLTGWKTHPKQPGNWRVVKGTNGNVLTGSGPATSHLFSARGDYQDFHLRVEARINDRGNSGVCFRTPFGPKLPVNNPKFLSGYEAQINSTHRDVNKTGSLYGVRPVVGVPESPVPPGEWFEMEVIVEGNHIIIKVKGKTTVDFFDEKRLFTRGYIALQQHNPHTVAEFRKIEIKELPAR